MDDGLVIVDADDVQDRVGLADVGQELIAEPLAAVRARDEAGDVVERDRVRDDLRRPHGAGDPSSRSSATGTIAMFGSIVVNG